MANVDNKTLQLIVQDIVTKITQPSITKKDLEGIGSLLKNDISEKSYTAKQVNTVIKQLLSKISFNRFTKKDVLNAENQILIENTLEKPFEKIFAEAETWIDKTMVILKIMTSSVLNVADDYILLFLTICIILTFQSDDRRIDDIYPYDENKSPYIDSVNQANEFLTTMNMRPGGDVDSVFIKAQVTNRNKSGVAPNDKSEKKLLFFAKMFMDHNADKSENELNVLGMISYVLLFSYKFTNQVMNNIDSTFARFISSIKNPIGFCIIVIVFYSIFLTNQYFLTNIFGPIINVDFTTLSSSSFGGFDIMTSFLNILSTFFCAFLTFFYFVFVIAYISSLIGCIVGYWNYASCSSSYFVKLLCFIGGLTYPVVLCLFLLALFTSNGNIKVLIQNIFNTLKTKVLTYVTQIQSLETQATTMENDVTSSL